MSGNKNLYNDATRKASNAAWDRKWEIAIQEYRRALAEFPDDAASHAGLALALQEANRLEEALYEYRVSAKLQSHDPVPLARTAALLEKLGKNAEAAAIYLTLAEMFTALKQMNKAVEAWRRASALEPDSAQAREKLIAAYKEAGHESAAATELVGLAKLYHREGKSAQAQSYAEQALALDAENSQAKALLVELTGRASTRGVGASDSPVEQARRSSLSRLAQTVFDDGPRWRGSSGATPPHAGESEVEGLLAKAIHAQTRGDLAGAIDLYQQIIQAGVARPEVQLNLALLYQQTLRYDDALALFKETVKEPQYALASYFAMGQTFRAQGKLDAALENFIQAMKVVDLSSVQRDQADQVIRLYESLADGYRAKGAEAHAQTFTQTLVDFLSSKGWEDKVREVRRHIAAVGASGTPVSFAEVLEMAQPELVIESLDLSEKYLKAAKYSAASEEAFRAIELAPDYLPGHVQLADVFEHAGRRQEAREKYETLAQVATVRGDVPKALAFYRHALKLAPADVMHRAKLIDLLVSNGQLPEALNEFQELGASLERAGQTQKAIDKYGEGLRLAQRAGVTSPAVGELRNRIAEAYFKAHDWQNALKIYQEMLQAAPEDERARFYVADLLLRLGRGTLAKQELGALLARYASSPHKLRAVLGTFARNFPDEPEIQLRYARTLADLGDRDKAIELLDALGERLLNAGDRGQAITVIREIIEMNPPQVDDYRQVLAELTQ